MNPAKIFRASLLTFATLLATQSANRLAAATNSPAEFKPVKSVFTVPKAQAEGKDPFFPHSVRVYGVSSTPKQGSTTQEPAVEFVLNGMSGTPERPLAIINNVTFGVNDHNDVIIKGRRIPVNCLEISLSEGRVRFQAGSEMRELRMPLNK